MLMRMGKRLILGGCAHVFGKMLDMPIRQRLENILVVNEACL